MREQNYLNNILFSLNEGQMVYKQKGDNNESLNRRAVSLSVHKKLVHCPKTAEQRPKELTRRTRYPVNKEPMWTNISKSAKIYPEFFRGPCKRSLTAKIKIIFLKLK